MNNRERVKAILHYENYDKMPVVHFGFWGETIQKWFEEGHITEEESKNGNVVAKKLGFEFEWSANFGSAGGLMPGFESKVLEELGDVWYIAQNHNGLVEKIRRGVDSIPATVGTLLTDRDAWEKLYLPNNERSPP